jgi:hypothetical protein
MKNAVPLPDPAKSRSSGPHDENPTFHSESPESYLPTGTRRRNLSKKFSTKAVCCGTDWTVLDKCREEE